MGLSLVTKLSPKRLVGLMMGGWFLATAVGNKMSGFISGLEPGTTDVRGAGRGHPGCGGLHLRHAAAAGRGHQEVRRLSGRISIVGPRYLARALDH